MSDIVTFWEVDKQTVKIKKEILDILLTSMEPKLKQDVLAPPQKSNIHQYSHLLATYISILRRKYTQPDCTQNAGSDPCYASVRCLIEIKSGNLRNHGQEWQVSDMDSFCSHWFYWKEICGLRANTIHYQVWDFTIMHILNLKKREWWMVTTRANMVRNGFDQGEIKK